MQRTLGIIKPDAVRKNVIGRILAHVEAAGIEIEALRMIQLTDGQARGFYQVHRDKSFFGSLVEFMTSGPCVIMLLKGDNVIERYRALMGATDPSKAPANTIRALYATDIEKNAVHGSDAAETAASEIDFFRAAFSRWT